MGNKGTDFSSDETTEVEALAALLQMSAESIRKGVRFHKLDVTDADGKPLFTASLTFKITRPVK